MIHNIEQPFIPAPEYEQGLDALHAAILAEGPLPELTPEDEMRLKRVRRNIMKAIQTLPQDSPENNI